MEYKWFMVGFSLLLPLLYFSIQIFYLYFYQCIIVVKKIRKTNIEWVEWVEKCRWFSTISKSQGLQSIPIYLMSMSRVVDSTIYFLGGDGVANISLWARTFLLILCFVISFYLLFRFSFSFLEWDLASPWFSQPGKLPLATRKCLQNTYFLAFLLISSFCFSDIAPSHVFTVAF